MLTPDSNFADRLLRLRRRFWPEPPSLSENHTQADYRQFMSEETFVFCPRYAKRRVVIHNERNLLEQAKRTGVITVFLHYGSWILTGGAVAHRLRLPYTVIASRRNLEGLIPTERQFWEGVHQRSSALYGNSIYYSDQNPRQPLRWLGTRGHVLGLALDVRELNQQQGEYPVNFLGSTLFMQCSPARLACLAKVPLVPSSIRFCPRERRHHLYFEPPVFPDGNPQRMTQQALNQLGKYVAQYPEQQFHDIVSVFSRPHDL